jgi:hypothetical protein
MIQFVHSFLLLRFLYYMHESESILRATGLAQIILARPGCIAAIPQFTGKFCTHAFFVLMGACHVTGLFIGHFSGQ